MFLGFRGFLEFRGFLLFLGFREFRGLLEFRGFLGLRVPGCRVQGAEFRAVYQGSLHGMGFWGSGFRGLLSNRP